jgi:hypothetical protein
MGVLFSKVQLHEKRAIAFEKHPVGKSRGFLLETVRVPDFREHITRDEARLPISGPFHADLNGALRRAQDILSGDPVKQDGWYEANRRPNCICTIETIGEQEMPRSLADRLVPSAQRFQTLSSLMQLSWSAGQLRTVLTSLGLALLPR